jgi:Domain of unknown function (DUF4124)
MKFRQIVGLLCASTLLLPVLAQAEMYKWKDKNGVMQYTDTPPPYGVKQLQFGNKKLRKDGTMQPTGREPLSQVVPEGQAAVPAKAPTNIAGKDGVKTTDATGKPKLSEEEAAKKRQQDAEADKKMKQEKEAQAKAKEKNCIAAKSNLETYKQGGRIAKVNEKGERSYLDDKALKAGQDEARKQMDEFCE